MQVRTKHMGPLLFSVLLFGLLLFLSYHHKIIQYLVRMAASQASILYHALPVEEYKRMAVKDSNAINNLQSIEDMKRFSVNELGFRPTPHYTRVYPDKGKHLLWVVNASNAYEIRAYNWDYPLLGKLSYKGFFSRGEAEQEGKYLNAQGYDADVGPVSAWSSLGWWPEPLLEKQLFKNKADFCALMFHELFHSTYFKAGESNLNENLADFVAEKACLIYLKQDREELNRFLQKRQSARKTSEFMLAQIPALNRFYDSIRFRSDRAVLKEKRIKSLVQNIAQLDFLNDLQKNNLQKDLMLHKNAAFIAYQQYRGLYDSLEFVFNNFYGGQIKKMVRSLRQD